MADTPDLGSGPARGGGSSPLSRTINSRENEDSAPNCTEFAQNSARPADRRVKFPVTIRHRSAKAKIYAPGERFAYYRLCYTLTGKRKMKTYASYSEAKKNGERILKEISQGSLAPVLSASQAQDALAAFERLGALRQATGRNCRPAT